jgi:hypothetical protein
MMPTRQNWIQNIFNDRYTEILSFLQELAYNFCAGDQVRYERTARRHRILPPSLRPQRPAVQAPIRYPIKLQWFVTWLGASVLSLLVFGVLVATHC